MANKHKLVEQTENTQESQKNAKKLKGKSDRLESDFQEGEDFDNALDSDMDEEMDEEGEDGDQEMIAGPGSIESVELLNFMCHKRLSVKFGKNLNFLTGPNGSGKSAVLTALAVALGGKTSFTNRANNISNLIKEGEDVGEITVRIRNTGVIAYQPDIFGDVIQIVRTLNRNGSGGYKIRSKKGTVVSSRKSELMSILDNFQIAVDNPMAILTQDTARLFLANSTSGQKYEFFMKGTALSTLDVKLSDLNSYIESISDSVNRKKENLPGMRAEVQQMKKKLEEMEIAAKHEETLVNLNGELVWSKLISFEEKKNEIEEKMEDHFEKYQDAEKKLRREEARLSELKEQITIIQQRESETTIDPIKNLMKEKQTAIRESKRIADETHADINALKAEISSSQENVDKALAALERERKKQSIDQKGLEEERNRQIAEIEDRLQSATNQMDMTDETVRKLDCQIESDLRIANSIGEKGRFLHQELNGLKSTATMLQNMRDNRLNGYGRNIVGAMREIEEATINRRWKGAPPIGPFGLHIQLKRQECRLVVESLLNHLLNGFGVDNTDDQRLLQNILKKHRCINTVYKYQAVRNFDYLSGAPDKSLQTLLDVIQVDNEIVFQQLVIHSKIESTVLVRDHAEGDRITRRNTYLPPKVTKVCTYDCFEVANSRGGRSTTMINKYLGPTRFVNNIEKEIEVNNRKIELKMRELDETGKTHNQMKSTMEQLKRDRIEIISHKRKLQEDIERYKVRIQSIQQSIEDQDPTNISHYTRLLNEAQEQLAISQRQMPGLMEKFNEAREKHDHLKNEYEELKKDYINEKNSVDDIKKEIEALSRKRAEIDSSITHYRKKYTSHEVSFKEAQKCFETAREIFDEQERQCLEYCARIETNRNESEIQSEIRRIEALVKEAEKEFGSRETFYKKFVKLYNELEHVESEVENYSEMIQILRAAYGKRIRAKEAFRKFVTTRCKFLFGNLIHKRGYRGQLDINHETKNLFLRVDVDQSQVDDDDQEATIDDRDPKTLSGGEKSYAQICLLLSLWSSMYTPFRCLDEFDVFMDAVNRRLAVKLLIDYARSEGKSSQFLLISPQNTSHLKELSGPDIQVLKMNPPERGQRTLDQFHAD